MPYVAEVLIPPLTQSYTYIVPENLQESVLLGSRVVVSLGKRRVDGFVISTKTIKNEELPTSYSLKYIIECLSIQPAFYSEDLKFYQWVANYYCESLSSVIETAIPAYIKPKLKTLLYFNDDFIEKRQLGNTQKKVIQLLKAQPGITLSEVLQNFPKCNDSIKRLIIAGAINAQTEKIEPASLNNEAEAAWAKKNVALNTSQEESYKEISTSLNNQEFQSFLLHGVTGSGKTEVYIEAVKDCIRQNKGALIIVPEIALTPQLIDRFVARLGTEIAVLHSGLNKNNRWNSWLALLEDRTRIAIGARSAIFAPIKNLGLIIVDEEHDSSFKQAEGLRYNARDLAIARAKLASCPVVLGSATPALETYARAYTGKYKLLTLPERPTGTTPLKIEIVDLNKIKFKDFPSKSISPRLFEAMSQALKAKEQIFIMYNKRGFASFLQCDSCGDVLMCPHCNVSLTYHQNNSLACCHYCGFNYKPPSKCLTCKDKEISSDKTAYYQLRGAGTEKVAEELQELFPIAKIDRLDRDVVSNFKEYRTILDRVRNGETEILVGTQMIAKGHDLPNVTLVGVIDCDVGIHFPDFRAQERSFQLLTQVAGRAGRAELPGRVILQTRVPTNMCLQSVLNKDYLGFAKHELAERNKLAYPPYSRLLRIICAANVKGKTLDIAKLALAEAQKIKTQEKLKIQILGPVEAPLAKLRMFWRYHLIVKSNSPTDLQKLIIRMKPLMPRDKVTRITFDLDPQDLL